MYLEMADPAADRAILQNKFLSHGAISQQGL
jgi:hypothetical protein